MSEQKRNEPRYVAETLAWCNKRRKEQGQAALEALPKGRREDPKSCPCGKATGLDVLLETAMGLHPWRKYTLPRSVRRFVKAFDRGDLPQYEAKS